MLLHLQALTFPAKIASRTQEGGRGGGEEEMTNKTPKVVSVRDNKLKWCEVGSTVSDSCLLYGKTPKFSVARVVQKITNF